jgi:hypothetical protein
LDDRHRREKLVKYSVKAEVIVMEGGSVKIEGMVDQNRALFLRKLRVNHGYVLLTGAPDFDSHRRARFEQACWRFHCAALRNRLKGAGAKRALKYMTELRGALGDLSWAPGRIAESLDELERELEYLASKVNRGRPTDIVGKWFRQVMHHFVPLARWSQRTARSLSQEEIDEGLAELSGTVFGRIISGTSFTRMRKREMSASKEETPGKQCQVSSRKN